MNFEFEILKIWIGKMMASLMATNKKVINKLTILMYF